MKYLKKAKSFLAIALSVAIALPILFNLQLGSAQSPPSRLLSDSDKSAVLAWIASETAAEKAPYCYRQSYGRGVGTVPTEAGANRVVIGALSYSQCPANMKREGFDCHSVCPDGMRDDGLFCRRSEYGRGAGYVTRGICNRNAGKYGSSECEKYGLLFYPKCREGYSAFGANICRPNAPNCEALGLGGRFDLSCAKKVIIGDAKPLVCESGKEKDAGLCYPNCRESYHGVGPVCWQNCNPGTFSCGAGCTVDKSSCAGDTFHQVLSPVLFAANFVTFGGASSATGAATGSGRLARLTATFNSAKDKLDLLYKKAKPLIDTGAELYKYGSVAAAEITAFNEAADAFALAAAEDMEALTTKNVVKALKENLSDNQYKEIVRTYALQQIQIASDKLQLDSLRGLISLDPTGITYVIDSFAKPICTRNKPFPKITSAQ